MSRTDFGSRCEGLLEDRGERGAGVFDVGVDAARDQRLMADVAAREIEAALDFEVGFGFDLLSEKFAEDNLLGEVFCADDGVVGARRRAGARMQRDRRDEEARAAHAMPRSLGGNLEPAFEQSQHCVGSQSQQGGGDGSGEHEAVVDRGDAAEDEFAETAGADGRRDGGDADAGDGGGAQAGEDERCGEGQFDFEEALRVGEAQGARYFDDRRVDAADAGVGVAQDGQAERRR